MGSEKERMFRFDVEANSSWYQNLLIYMLELCRMEDQMMESRNSWS